MSKQNRVTANDLRKKGASCLDQIAVFEKEWPKGVTLTKNNILRAIYLGLDIEWYAKNFLPKIAWSTYLAIMMQAWKAYDETMTPVLRAHNYDTVRAQALKKYHKTKAQSLAGLCGEIS